MTTATEPTYGEKGDTWPKILRYNYKKYGDRHRAMRHKNLGIWKPYTWKDYYLNVKSLALGLSAIGFEPGNKLLIVGDNAPQWHYAELAAQANHGVSVGAYSDLTPQEIKYIAENSEASFAVVEDQEQADKLLQIKDELPLLKKVIYWNYKGLAHYNDEILLGYRDVLQAGEKYGKEHPGLFEQNVETGKEDDVCAIVYTSGTSGIVPKGAVHTYRTIKAGACFHLRLDPWQEDDNVIPYLPPAWITEQWLGIGCHLLSGCILNFAEASDTQQRDANEIQPNIVFYSSRLWQTLASDVQARMQSASAMKRFAYRKLMPIGYRMAALKYKKTPPGLLLKMLYFFADLSLFRFLRRSLGLSNSRICYAGGAILSTEAFKFYHAINLPLKSLYGTTEGGALTGSDNDDLCLETVGPAHRGTEVKITAEGELVYRQPGVFVGYYKDHKKTDEVIKDGWFYSGDSGFLREDGHIVFVDRIKSLVALPDGRQIAPQFIESQLTFNPYIKDAWVIAGNGKNYISAVIVINYIAVGRWAGQRKVPYSTFAELSQRPEVQDLVKQAIAQINLTLPEHSRVRRYVNLHREFEPDEGELTRSRKLRRMVLEERYQGLIEAIYSDRAAAPIEVVGHRDGRKAMTQTTLSINSVEGAAL